MPQSMIFNRLRYYRYETITLLIVFACLTLFAVWKPEHIRVIESEYIAQATSDLTADDNEMRLLNAQPIQADMEGTIREILGADLMSLHKLRRTGGLTCGLESNCHQGFAIDDPTAYIRLLEGEFPQQTADDTHVQAVISRVIADRKDYEVGAMFLFGADRSSPITVEIVGIFEAIDPASRIWTRNDILITGVDTPVGTNFRFDFGFMVTEQVFNDIIDPASQAFLGSVYNWIIQVEPVPATLEQVKQRQETLQAVQQAFLQVHLQGDVVTRTFSILERIERHLEQLNLQLWVLFFLAVLMLAGYGVYIHHDATLQQIEWQRLSEMGFRSRVILRLRIQILLMLAIGGWFVGRMVATFLWGFPSISEILLAAMVVAFAMLLMVIAGQSTSFDEQSIRKRPLLFDAQIDLLLIVSAGILFVRLFIMSSSNIGESIQQLFATPTQIFTQIAPELAQMPVNFLIPFLLTVGMLILAMRVVWLVLGDEPQVNTFAVVLIALSVAVTLAVILLNNRLDQRLQADAMQQTGGTARVLFNADADITLPESISDYAELTFVQDRSNTGDIVTLVGVDVPQFVEVFPDYASQLEALLNAPDSPLPGIPLSDDALAISLDVYSLTDETDVETSVKVALRLLDNQGRASHLELTPVVDAVPNQFVTYQASLAELDHTPLRLSGLVLGAKRSDTRDFEHTFYFDNLTLYHADDASVDGSSIDGRAEVIEDFEANTLPDEWIIFSGTNPDIASQMRFSAPAHDSGSLRTTIRMTDTRNIVIMPIAPVPSFVNIPAIASPEFIRWIENRSNRRTEIIGSNQQAELSLPLGIVDLSYQVVDTIDSFPVVEPGRYLIMPLQALLFYLNDRDDMTRSYEISELWLSIAYNDLDEIRPQLPASTLYAEDIYQQARNSVYPWTMIDLLALLSLLSTGLSGLIIIRLYPWKVLLITVFVGALLGVFGAYILASLFPIFSMI